MSRDDIFSLGRPKPTPASLRAAYNLVDENPAGVVVVGIGLVARRWSVSRL
jgi:hypothetical protein